jgi:hypothetical protein
MNAQMVLIACGILIAFLAYSLNLYINHKKLSKILKIIFIFFSIMILSIVAYVLYSASWPETNNSMTNSNFNITTTAPNTKPIAIETSAPITNEAQVEGISQYVTPPKGSLNTLFIYNFSRKNFPSELFLELKDPQTNTWKSFGKGKSNLDNITFVVPDLSFIGMVFLGDVEFRLKNSEDNLIYSSKGPHVDINFKNIAKNTHLRTISVDVILEVFEGEIYLKYHNTTLIERYTGCGKWQRLNFGPLNDLKDGDILSLGNCKVEYGD